MRESNSHQRFWRPLSYHLTNPLCFVSVAIIHTKGTVVKAKLIKFARKQLWNGDGGIWTLAPVTRPTAFRVRTLQPLGYISILRLKTVLKCNRNCFLLYKESTERSILFLLTNWFCCNKIITKCGCVPSGLLLSGDNKQLRGKQIGDDHDRKKENNSGGCGEADRYLP